MKNILIFLTAILVLSQIVMAQTDDDYKKIFRNQIEIGKSGSSLVAVLVDEKGTRFVNYGTLSKDANSAQADEKTIYEIGSLTKLFVGVLLADAVDRGELKLVDPISKYLPQTLKTPKYDGKEITLLDLATHTSGLPRMPNNFAPKDNSDPYKDYSTKNLYDFLSKYKLTREIGKQYEYSNLGFGLLGHILSLQTKMSLEQLLTKRIFEPLGMNDTSFALQTDKKARYAQGFDEKNKPTALWFFDALAGAGAIRSTSADMAKFISASVGITKTPLSKAFAEAEKGRRPTDQDGGIVGLGWNTSMLGSMEINWHGGGTGGFRSYIAIAPSQKAGNFLVMNSGLDAATEFIQSIAFNALRKHAPAVKPKTAMSLDEEVLQKYVGEYSLAPTFSIAITRDGKRLFLQATGQQKFELFAEKEGEFFLKEIEASISFTKDTNGKIDGLVLHQDGRNTPAKKVK